MIWLDFINMKKWYMWKFKTTWTWRPRDLPFTFLTETSSVSLHRWFRLDYHLVVRFPSWIIQPSLSTGNIFQRRRMTPIQTGLLCPTKNHMDKTYWVIHKRHWYSFLLYSPGLRKLVIRNPIGLSVRCVWSFSCLSFIYLTLHPLPLPPSNHNQYCSPVWTFCLTSSRVSRTTLKQFVDYEESHMVKISTFTVPVGQLRVWSHSYSLCLKSRSELKFPPVLLFSLRGRIQTNQWWIQPRSHWRQQRE